MKNINMTKLFVIAFTGLALAAAGCSKHSEDDGHDHGSHDGHDHESAVPADTNAPSPSE